MPRIHYRLFFLTAFLTTFVLAGQSYSQAFLEICESKDKTASQQAFYQNIFDWSKTTNCQDAYEYIARKGKVELSDRRITSLGPLKDFKEVTSVFLRVPHIWDISVLSTLPNLAFLKLENTGPVDLAPLKSLQNLKQVSFRYADNAYLAENLADLAEIASIDTLSFVYMQVGEQPAVKAILARMTELQHLTISMDAGLKDISFLSGLTKLSYINLSGTEVADLSALKEMRGIENLFLIQTPVADISVLRGNCKTLYWLMLHGTLVEDLSPLENCTETHALWLSSLKLRKLFDMSKLYRIAQISLEDNFLTDLAQLSTIGSVGTIALTNNKVEDLSPLRNLSNLHTLEMAGNPLGSTIEKTEQNCPTDTASEALAEFCANRSKNEQNQFLLSQKQKLFEQLSREAATYKASLGSLSAH